MIWRKLTLCAALAGGLALPGCLAVSVERRCLDCGGPMSECLGASEHDGQTAHDGQGESSDEVSDAANGEPTEHSCEDGQACRRPLKRFDLWAEARLTSEECVARLRGLCMKPPAPLAPPTARYHPVPTRPVFSPACYDEPPPLAALESGAEALPQPPSELSDETSDIQPPVDSDSPSENEATEPAEEEPL